MSLVQLSASGFVVALALASVLPATVDGSTFRKYKLGSYAKAKDFNEPLGYRLVGKTTQGFQRSPAVISYRQAGSSTTKDSSPSGSAISSLLGRLLHSGGRPSAGSGHGSGTARAFSPFVRWLSNSGPTSVTVNSDVAPQGGDAGTAGTGSSTAPLLSLIRSVMKGMRTSKPTTDAEDPQTTPAETAESRIKEMIAQLLGRQAPGVSVTVLPGPAHTRANVTGTTTSQLLTIIQQLLGHQQPSGTTDDDTGDAATRKPSFNLMTLIRRLMGVDDSPSKASGTGGAAKIPAPMPSHAALRALIRWMARLDRTQTSNPNSPGRFASIIMQLLSRMASSKSSATSSTSTPSDALIKWLSNINKPGVSVRTSSTTLPTSLTTFLTDIQGQGSTPTTSSSISSSLDKWLRDEQNLRSSSRTSSTSPLLAKLMKALEKSGASQGTSTITSYPPLVRWLGPVASSGGGSSARAATDSGGASLRKLFSALQRYGPSHMD